MTDKSMQHRISCNDNTSVDKFAIIQNCLNHSENRAQDQLVRLVRVQNQIDHQILLFMTHLFKQFLSTFQTLPLLAFRKKYKNSK